MNTLDLYYAATRPQVQGSGFSVQREPAGVGSEWQGRAIDGNVYITPVGANRQYLIGRFGAANVDAPLTPGTSNAPIGDPQIWRKVLNGVRVRLRNGNEQLREFSRQSAIGRFEGGNFFIQNIDRFMSELRQFQQTHSYRRIMLNAYPGMGVSDEAYSAETENLRLVSEALEQAFDELSAAREIMRRSIEGISLGDLVADTVLSMIAQTEAWITNVALPAIRDGLKRAMDVIGDVGSWGLAALALLALLAFGSGKG